MAQAKKSMYEILGVSPTATQAELKAAHRRLSFEIMSGKQGLDPEDCKLRLQVLDIALNTLSDPVSRDAYDMQQAAASQANTALPVRLATGPVANEVHALQLATAVDGILKDNSATIDERQFQFKVVSQTVGASLRSVKTILRIVALLLLLGMVLRMSGCMMAARKPAFPAAAVATAEEKLIVQAHFKKHGVRAANRAEVEAFEAENRARETARREDEFKQQRAADETRRFIEESQDNYRRAELEQERAQAEARYQAMRRQELEEAMQRQQVSQPRYGASGE